MFNGKERQVTRHENTPTLPPSKICTKQIRIKSILICQADIFQNSQRTGRSLQMYKLILSHT